MKKMLFGLIIIIFIGLSNIVFAWENNFAPTLYPAKVPPRVYVGVTGGYARIFHSEGISNPLGNQSFDAIKSNSFFVGLCGEYILGDAKLAESSITLKTLYTNILAARSTFSESESIVLPSGQSAVVKTQNHASFKASFINAEILYYRNNLFGTVFSIGGGIGTAFPIIIFNRKKKGNSRTGKCNITN